MSNVATAMVEAAEQFPKRIAVQDEGRALTYAELDELSARAAGGLLAHGVGRGDRVGLRLPHTAAFTVLCFGALRAGATVVPLFPQTRRAETRPQSDALSARVVFADPEAMEIPDNDAGGTTAVPAGRDFLDQLALWPQHHAVADRTDQDTAVVAPANGTRTTERSAAVLSHRSLHSIARTVSLLISRAAIHDRQGRPAHSSFPFGQTYGLQAALLAGACLPGCSPMGRRTNGSVSPEGRLVLVDGFVKGDA
ncbi:AMP-binding protein [Streptomyces sp. NPDC059906]|uniref:AMP-binding protein n=1 Tax=Streptomyces sp. NPDC059906 TaxID=3346997 RepID=UPI0036623231